jgi:hypothetical protein
MSRAIDSNDRFSSGANVCNDLIRGPYSIVMTAPPNPKEIDPLTVDVPREFHRRMAAIIEAVQTGIWQRGVHDLLGYATDYAFGDKRGLQTLVLKSKHRSAYVRLQWETIMSEAVADRQLVENAIQNAIHELT